MSLFDDIAFFRRFPLFSALDKEALRTLAIGAETRKVQTGSVLFYAGELADGGYLVAEGTVLLEPGSFAEGKDVRVGVGTLIGEMALLNDMVWQATAIAQEPVTVLRLPRSLFRKMLEGYPAAAVALRDLIAKRLNSFQRELSTVKKKMEKGGS